MGFKLAKEHDEKPVETDKESALYMKNALEFLESDDQGVKSEGPCFDGQPSVGKRHPKIRRSISQDAAMTARRTAR